MTTTIQYTTELATGLSYDRFILIAEVDTVRGAREVDLTEVHNAVSGEMWEMGEWEDMLDCYEDRHGKDSAAHDGILCWHELQDLVAGKGE